MGQVQRLFQFDEGETVDFDFGNSRCRKNFIKKFGRGPFRIIETKTLPKEKREARMSAQVLSIQHINGGPVIPVNARWLTKL